MRRNAAVIRIRAPRQIALFCAGAFALLLGGCAGSGSMVMGQNPASSVSPVGSAPLADSNAAKQAAAASSAHSLAAIQSWSEPALSSLDKPSATLAALVAQPASLLIVNPATLALSNQKNEKVKPLEAVRQDGKRKVLALLQISHITPSDPDWNKAWVDSTGKLTPAAPSWLEASDPKTPGVYPVQYWNKDWQKRVGSSLMKLVTAGYDGVCLQGAGDFAAQVKAHPSAGPDMADWVESLADQARKKNAGFSVVTDGGEALPDALTTGESKSYYATIDGIVAHDVFYPGPKPTDNDLLPSSTELADLDGFHQAGAVVFVTERLTNPDKIADFLTRAKSKGYIPDAALTPPVLPVPTSLPSTPAAAAPKTNTDPQVADARS